MRFVAMHETLHSVGFQNAVPGQNVPANCTAQDTVMFHSVGPNGGVSALTCADNAAMDGVWRRDESPIILNIYGGAIRLSSAWNGVRFDIAARGVAELVAWPLQPWEVAFLVFDRNGNRIIDDARELFGNNTPLAARGETLASHRDGRGASMARRDDREYRLYSREEQRSQRGCIARRMQPEFHHGLLASGETALNGYEALEEFDADGNGWVEAGDPAYWALRLWFDTNRNGETDPGELASLTEIGIVALSTTYRESRRTDRFGNTFRYFGRVRSTTPASATRSWDVYLITIRR